MVGEVLGMGKIELNLGKEKEGSKERKASRGLERWWVLN